MACQLTRREIVTKMDIDSYVCEYDCGCQSARAMTTESCM